MTLSERLKKFDMYPQEDSEMDAISPELAALCMDLTKALSKKIATIPIWFEYSKEEQQSLIKNFLNTKLNDQFSEIKLTATEKERISKIFYNSVYGFGSLDFLIAQQDITKIFVNSPDEIYIEKLGHIENAHIKIDEEQFQSLINKMTEISGKQSSVITFRFNNLLVTILKEPVCSTKLILKKVLETEFDLGYFERRGVLNEDISEFFRMILNCKKRVMISSPVQCGKTSLLNAFLNEVPEKSRTLLFEEGALINSTRNGLTRFDVEGLNKKEQNNLITTALYYKSDYIFSDTNDLEFNIEISELKNAAPGFISTVRANSYIETFSYYISVLSSRLKCTEKVAKMRFANDIDYIIQLEKEDNHFRLSSIVSVSSNKVGTPVLTEILTFKSGEYKYKFDSEINTETTQKPKKQETDPQKKFVPPKKLTFSARLKN